MRRAVHTLVAQLDQIGPVGLEVEQAIAGDTAEAQLVVLAAHHRAQRLERVDEFGAAAAHVAVGLLVQARVLTRAEHGGRERCRLMVLLLLLLSFLVRRNKDCILFFEHIRYVWSFFLVF